MQHEACPSSRATRTLGRGVVLSDDTWFGENVQVGNHVTFYPGVSVGDGCIIMDGAVIGRPPRATRTTTRPLGATTAPVMIGAGSIIGANAVLYSGITIGEQVMISDLASVREGCRFADGVIIGRGVLVMYNTVVGARTRVIDGAILTGEMTIEEDVFIGPGANAINDNDVYLTRFGLQAFDVRGPQIRRFALIGAGANVAAGVEIGMGAIVAPNAMVTGDVPAWSVVAGVPAKRVREIEMKQRLRLLRHFGLDDRLAQTPV